MQASSCSPPTFPEYVLRTCCGKPGWQRRARTGCSAATHLAKRRLGRLDEDREAAHLVAERLERVLHVHFHREEVRRQRDGADGERISDLQAHGLLCEAAGACWACAEKRGWFETWHLLRSFVVSQPSVPPAPSDSATHLLMLLRSNAFRRCWLSNAKFDSKLSTRIASSNPGISRTFWQWSITSLCVFATTCARATREWS